METKKSFLEKRGFRRSAVRLPIQYRLMTSAGMAGESRGKVALAKELSLDGVSLKIMPDQALKAGEIIRLDIILPDVKKHFPVYGEVVWINRNGAGVHLTLMPEKGRKFLEKYLARGGKRGRPAQVPKKKRSFPAG